MNLKMGTLYFISGNQDKFKEAQTILPGIKSIKLDLLEIQELNPKKIIAEKLKEAYKTCPNEIFCEDTSLYIHSLNGLPGPLIKWFLQALGNQGIYQLVKDQKDKTAEAKTIIGYTNGTIVRFFEGEISGEIVKPKGNDGFGWDPLFKPEGYMKTFAEMNPEEKNEISMRRIALMKLKDYLNEESNLEIR